MDWITFSDLTVYVGSLISPLIILPQILRVWRLKDARSISILTFLGSVLLQMCIFINATLHKQPQIQVSMLLSLAPLIVLLGVVIYFRRKNNAE